MMGKDLPRDPKLAGKPPVARWKIRSAQQCTFAAFPCQTAETPSPSRVLADEGLAFKAEYSETI